MIKLDEFVNHYIEDHQSGFADDLISEYIRLNELEYSTYKDVKIKAEEILLQKENISFSKSTGKFTILDKKIKGKIVYMIQDFGSYLSGRFIEGDTVFNLNEISQDDIMNCFSEFKIINIGIYDNLIRINFQYEDVAVGFTLEKIGFQIRATYSLNINEISPFFEFLQNENEYTIFKKGYLPLDSILYHSFLKLNNFLTTKFQKLLLKIDIFEHVH